MKLVNPNDRVGISRDRRTGKEIEIWRYWEDLMTNRVIVGEYYADYKNGRTIEPVTKPYAFDWPGSLEVGVYRGSEIVPICYISGLSDELKEKFANDKSQIIMRPITITGMEATDKSIRHPKFIGFRDDIPIADCLWEKIFDE